MNVTVNGVLRRVAEHTTLRELAPGQRGLAIALNGAVVPAAEWAVTALVENDAVEIVTAHQGG